MNRLSFAMGLALLAVAMLSCDTGEVPQDPPPNLDGILLDVAGTQGVAGNGGDGGPALACSLFWPVDVTVFPGGQLLVVDRINHRIRRVGVDGTIQAFIGSGIAGDDTSGNGTDVDLNSPLEIRMGPNQDYYVSVGFNWRVKKFDWVSLSCSTVAGEGIRGFRGDGGPATTARLDEPSSVVFDTDGNMYIVDKGNTRIRRVEKDSGIITTFAGGRRGSADGIGEDAEFSFPGCETISSWCGRPAIDISPDGMDLYLADTENHLIRRINISTRTVTTIAGTGEPGWEGDGGPALSAKLSQPTDIEVAGNGELYIADSRNNVIRRIDLAGIISTVAGNGSVGMSPQGTRATDAMLFQPEGISFDDATNTLYIADTYNHQIRKVINP